ncbi:MAG: hypothetical protein ACPGVD_00980 [Flavobacteriales bacterium]
MKRFTLILIASLFILNCSTEKTTVDEIAEMRCDCLRLHSIEKENFMEVIECINEVNANEKFKDLGEEEILEKMKQICPDAALKEK